MDNKFEKMDEWMMKASRGIREDKSSGKELYIFHENVMKKIIAQQASGWSLPQAGLVFAAVFSVAVLLGAGFYLYQARDVKPAEKPVRFKDKPVGNDGGFIGPRTIPFRFNEKPVQAEVIRVTAPLISAPLSVSPPEGARNLLQPAVVSALPPAFKEEDILLEIEALKELGVWTEEDEEEAGIPVEAAFAEFENYISENQSPVILPSTARS